MNRPVSCLPSLLAVVLTVAGGGCHSHDHPGQDHQAQDHEGHDHQGQDHDGHDHESQDHDGHDHAQQADDGEHAHGEDAIGITLWTEKLELFAEHPPAIAGRKLAFLAHLTVLPGFRALEDAVVTLVLEGPERVEARAGEKLRPGIFEPVLTAPRPGTYRGRLVITGPVVEDTLGGFEIVVHETVEAAKRAVVGQPGGVADPITFLKEQQWQVPFATAFAAEGRIVPSIEVGGEVATPPSGQAEVGAFIAGRVVPPSAGLPRPGQTVRRGQLLATLAPAPAAPEAGAGADLAVVEAEARVQAARAALERAERLIADKAISLREVDEARRELRVAEEAGQAARRARDVFIGAASGRGEGIYRVTAPMDGVIVEVQATPGKSVNSGDLLFRLVDLSELWIRARVPEQEASRLRPDQDAAFKLPGLDTWLPLDLTGENASASVISIGRIVDPRSRTVDVIYALRRPDDRLRVGGMVRVGVPTGDTWQGVVVPRSAVFEENGRAIVYVQVEGETFEERVVRLGPRSGSLVGIEAGVALNERVVTHGGNIVRLSARAPATAAHGHLH